MIAPYMLKRLTICIVRCPLHENDLLLNYKIDYNSGEVVSAFPLGTHDAAMTHRWVWDVTESSIDSEARLLIYHSTAATVCEWRVGRILPSRRIPTIHF